jgi:hypothetical protein
MASNSPPIATNWGKSEQGVKLSIFMTNNTIEPGSAVCLTGVITNSSLNAISMREISDVLDFGLLLTNASGRFYNLTPRFEDPHRVSWVEIRPGEEIVAKIPAAFSTNIAAGNYTLIATRKFKGTNEWSTVDSNPLEVHVK